MPERAVPAGWAVRFWRELVALLRPMPRCPQCRLSPTEAVIIRCHCDFGRAYARLYVRPGLKIVNGAARLAALREEKDG